MLAFTGVVLLCLALAWNPYFPINKRLWTSSFTLFARRLDPLVVGGSDFVDRHLADRAKKERSAPAEPTSHPSIYKPVLVFGTNAILAYMDLRVGCQPQDEDSYPIWGKPEGCGISRYSIACASNNLGITALLVGFYTDLLAASSAFLSQAYFSSDWLSLCFQDPSGPRCQITGPAGLQSGLAALS